MVETISTSESSPSMSMLSKKRPLDFYPNKAPSPSNKFTTLSASVSAQDAGKLKCSCCVNMVGILMCRNLFSGIDVHVPKANGYNSVLSYSGFSAEGSCKWIELCLKI